MYAGGFLGPFGGGMVTVLIPELRDAFGVSTAGASLALTIYLVPFAVLQLVSGTIGERIGRAGAIRAAFGIYALASLWAAATSGFGAFLAARALQGAANAFTTPLVLASLADATPAERLGRAMGTFAAVQTAGVVCAPLVGGLAGSVDYRLAFVAAAAAALLLVVGAVPAGSQRGAGPARLRDAATPRARRVATAAFLAYFGITGLGVIVVLRAGDAFGLGATTRGALLAGFGVAGVVAGRPAGAFADRRGAVAVAVAGALACAGLLPLLGLVRGPWGLAAAWAAAGVFSAVMWAGLNVLTVGSAPANRGGAVSLIGAFKFAGSAAAPIVWVPVYAFDPRLAFALAGGVSLLVAAATARSPRAPTYAGAQPGGP